MNDQIKITKNDGIAKKLIYPIRYVMMKLVWEPKYWKKRISDVINCPDIKFIPVVSDAGQIKEGFLIMHNGLKIEPLSYYGRPMLKLFKRSKGIHEPQEERFFLEVIKLMRTGAIMLELGSYWSFYSMCFNAAVTDAKNFMVEPTASGLKMGEKNFEINQMKGNFTQAYIGKEPGLTTGKVDIITVDKFVEEKQLPFIDILHADIQGYEVEMLEGADKVLLNKRVGYIFISTHSNNLHKSCIEILKNYQYIILQSINLDESYSLDGLIVAVSPTYPLIKNLELSKRK